MGSKLVNATCFPANPIACASMGLSKIYLMYSTKDFSSSGSIMKALFPCSKYKLASPTEVVITGTPLTNISPNLVGKQLRVCKLSLL